jgi:hypothetical protein
MIKKLIISIFLLGFSHYLKSQGIRSINPTNPIVGDTITVEIFTTLPYEVGPPPNYCGVLDNWKDSIYNNNIDLDILINVSGVKFATGCARLDTFKVVLPSSPGTYLFTCYWSSLDSLDSLYTTYRSFSDTDTVVVNTLNDLEEFYKRPIRIYPNPASDHLTIDAPSNMIKSISITSIKGEVIFEGSSTNRINLRDYSQGIYFMQVQLSNGRIITEKLLVK